jgi:hypothetical protein
MKVLRGGYFQNRMFRKSPLVLCLALGLRLLALLPAAWVTVFILEARRNPVSLGRL